MCAMECGLPIALSGCTIPQTQSKKVFQLNPIGRSIYLEYNLKGLFPAHQNRFVQQYISL